ncbi:hypothetical protein JHV675_54970 [Mycobacterium avium subsp. hominissuis]
MDAALLLAALASRAGDHVDFLAHDRVGRCGVNHLHPAVAQPGGDRGGVEVVDAAPAELAPALADHYLAMKATG